MYICMQIVRTLIASFCVVASLVFLATVSWAQTSTISRPNNPPMASAELDSEKEALYARFNDFKRNPNPEQQRYAYPTAKEYLRHWGGEKDAETKEVRKWVTEYERAMHEGELYAAYDAKDYAKVFELAGPLVKADPEYFFALAILTEAGYQNSLTRNTSRNTETADYARQAIQLIEAGKVTKVDPFKSMAVARGFLNYVLGTMVKDEKPGEAAAAFLKAVKSDSPFHTDPLAYYRLGSAIYKGELMQLSSEYNNKFGGKQSSPEQTAMLNRILHLAERSIDAYARAVALNTKPEQQDARGKILAQLTTLYKSFHNNSDEGLNELIAGVLSKPMPE